MQSIAIAGSIILSFNIIGCHSQSETALLPVKTNTEIKRGTILSATELDKLDSVDVDFQLRGHCYAFSSASHAKPSNGEAHSGNVAQPIDESFMAQGLYLAINEKELVKIDNRYLGHKLYLVNADDTATSFNAQDSRLNIIAEVLNEKGFWVPITYLPSSWCGNSYHTVVLGSGEYWSFDVPVFNGKVKTKLRYSLSDGDKQKIISNEIVADINSGQLNPKSKQGHTVSGIMDPYND